MPRNPKRKTDIGSFSEETMQGVVKLVEQGWSIRRAAKEKSLAYQTVARYAKKKQENPNIQIRMRPNYEVRKVFTTEQERSLANFIVKCSKMFYGLPIAECRKLAFEMAVNNKVTTPETWVENKTAGIEWMRSFLKRHPALSLRTPEGCSLSRATSFNRHNIELFFNNLHDVMQRSKSFADGTRIFNLDETGVVTVQKPQKVIAEKGMKQVSRATSAEKGTLVTTCCIINASGNTLPPAMIFPRVHFKEYMLAGAPPGTLGLATQSGWMNTELFVKVMNHYIKHTSSSPENPSLLIYDNHESHLSIEVLNLAKENGVTILTVPPLSTHKLQPLDVGIFKPFSTYYNSAVDSWMMQHPGKPISIYEVAGCVGIAHQKAMTPSNIIAAFKNTGIYPYDRHIFTDADFMPSEVTDRVASTVVVEHLEQDADGKLRQNSSLQVPVASCSQPTVSFQSPEDFRGFPKAGERKYSGKGRKKGKSIVATDTPVKNAIEAGKMRKEKTRTKPKKQLFKEDIHSSCGSCDEISNTICVDEQLEEVATPTFHELETVPQEGDYVLVSFKSANRYEKSVFYIGKILNLKSEHDDDGDYVVSFLRRSEKVQNKFVMPNIPDISSVPQKDIKMVLPRPVYHGQTKRQQSYLSFDTNFSNIEIR